MTDQQDIWVPRLVTSRLPRPGERTLVILTGPRQAGKTTLAQRVYPDLRYLSMDSIEEREALRAMRTEAWA
ncbi:MAG: AAA family ATPase, partial [Planctomycetota bacterium]